MPPNEVMTATALPNRSPPSKNMKQLRVSDPHGASKTIDVCDATDNMDTITVGDLNKKIRKQLRLVTDFRMVYSARTLEEDKTLGHYGIRHMAALQTIYILPGGTPHVS